MSKFKTGDKVIFAREMKATEDFQEFNKYFTLGKEYEVVNDIEDESDDPTILFESDAQCDLFMPISCFDLVTIEPNLEEVIK